MDTTDTDTRTTVELEAILKFCQSNKVDAGPFLDDPECTLCETAKRIELGKSFALAPVFEIYRAPSRTLEKNRNRHAR